jgi:N-acetylmuramoyl-L-alanine amidase
VRGPAKVTTIIIDPGHGGKDQGAMVGGVNEAQVTLAVGKELKAALAKLGYKALMTREDDQFISLQERPKFASDKGGDLFISLHCNSIAGSMQRKKTVSGFTAYILREGESEEDKALARRENQAISEESGKSKAEISPVEWILLEHQLNLYSKESEGFAELIVKEFGSYEIGKYATGASQAGFYVLVGAYMPAILFEMGYLTNDADRRILSSEKGQKAIADRLAKAIDKYRKAQLGGATAKEEKAKRK